MKKCHYCQSDIPDKAKRCPSCQGDLRNWFIRHYVWTVVIGLFALVFVSSSVASLSSKKVAQEINRPSNQPTASPTENEPAVIATQEPTNSPTKTVSPVSPEEIKRVKYENLFKTKMKNGFNVLIARMIADYLLNADTADLNDTVKGFNELSALISLGKTSSNEAVKNLALGAEPEMVKIQKYYFPLFRKDYIDFRNKNKEMDENFEYPNRCIEGAYNCGIFYVQESFLKQALSVQGAVSYDCDNSLEEARNERFSDFVKLHKNELEQFRVPITEISFISTPPSNLFYCEPFKRKLELNVVSDNKLMPVTYLGL